MKRILLLALIIGVSVPCGCDKKREEPKAESPGLQPPRALIKRVPCKIRFGPLAAALEVDLNEVRNFALDANQLYREIVHGDPSSEPPSDIDIEFKDASALQPKA